MDFIQVVAAGFSAMEGAVEENRQRTILLVEDQALVAATEQMLLQQHGYAIITANTGEKAVELALGTSNIDLILMDIDLGPGIDGTEAAKIILDTCDIPIVFLSGHTEPEVVEKTELITSYGYIVKNSGDTVLLASLKMAFRLRESERKFRSAFESVSVGMVLTSPSGELLRANAAFAQMLGRSVAEVQAVNFADLTHPDDVDISFRHLRAMLEGETDTAHFSKRYVYRDGHPVWTDVSTILLRDSLGEPLHFVTHVQDITERLRNEVYLHQFEHIVSSTRDGIALLDQSYRYRIVNRAYEHFSGRKAESLVGLHVRDYLGDEFFQDSVRERFDRCLDGETVQYKTWVEYPTLGKRFVQVTYFPYYNEQNAIDGVVANTRDMTQERLIEEELEKRRREHHQLLESAPVSILVVQDGSYVYANPYGAALLGYSSPAELVGVPALSTIAPESHAAVQQRLEEIAAGRENAPQEMVLLRKDGGTLWAESSSIPIVYDDRPAALIIGRDLTEQKRIADRLRAAESIAHIGHYDIDLQSGTAFWSEETYRIFGLDASRFEPTMQSYAALIHEADREAVYAQVEQCIRYQTDFDMVYRIRRDDGDWRTVHSIGRVRTDTAGAVVGLLGTIQDITERTVAETELTESRNRLLSVFRATPTGIGLVQGPDRTIIEANEKLCTMTGYSREELIGQSALVLYPSREDYDYVGTEKYRQIAEAGTGAVETRWQCKDGAVIDILLASSPLDAADISQGVTFTAMDITEQKRADARIRQLVLEKETLLQEVQHRVKNTMNTMVSLLSLQADALQSAEAVDALRDAQSRFKSMGTLYDHLYRREAHDAGSVREYLADLVGVLAGAFPTVRNTRVTTDIEDRVLDGKRLSTVGLIVNELVTNSLKHAFPGREDGRLHVRSGTDGEYVTIVVEDNGTGFPEPPAGESSTFGMTMVRALTEQLGGTIRFEQEDGGMRAVLRFIAE